MRKLKKLLAMGFCFGLVPMAAFAADVQLGTPAFAVNTDAPTIVGFGGKQWLVVGYDGNGVAGIDGALTLLLAKGQSYGTTVFNPMVINTNVYSGSTLQTVMDSAYNDSLLDKEKPLVLGRTLEGNSGNLNEGTYNPNNIAGASVSDAKFWPLSVSEVRQLNSSLYDFDSSWWLRTPGAVLNTAATVSSFRWDVGEIGSDVTLDFIDSRPAFHLDLISTVLFVSAMGAKSSVVAGSSLAPAAAPSGAIKFTMEDSSLHLDSITPMAISGRTITFDYISGSGGVTDQTLSAVVLDENGALRYYGKLQENIGAYGTAAVTVPDDFAPTDTLNLFVEECNGDNETDFASAYVLFPVTVAAQPAGLGSVACTTPANNYGQITGTTTTMEYSADGGASWAACTATSLTGLAPGTYLVRVQANNPDMRVASLATTVSVGAYTLSPVPPAPPEPGVPTATEASPQTGDGSNAGVWLALFVVSGLGITGLLVRRKWRQVKGI